MINDVDDFYLLPCPFCGNGGIYTDTNGKAHFVWCDECGCGTGDRPNKASAIRKWNTRGGHLWTKQDFKDAAWEQQNSDIIDN